jgi:hypothetical protein
MTTSVKSSLLVVFAFAAISVPLSSCSRDNGTIPVSPSPTPAVSASINPSMASVTGTVVDTDYDNPLVGVPVQIAAYTPAAPYKTVATTGANGQFAFTTTPGQYLLLIGTNSDTSTQATYHGVVNLKSGQNPLLDPVPTSEPDVTTLPGQSSGVFRLAQLSVNEQDCLSGINASRISAGLSGLIEDESLLEGARAYNDEQLTQNATLPNPLGSNPSPIGTIYGAIGYLGNAASENYASCDEWSGPYTLTPGNPPYQYASKATTIWYGASFGGNATTTYGEESFGQDPR